VDPTDGTDGWVIATPTQAIAPGEIITITVGALTASGGEVDPVYADFRADKMVGGETPPAEPYVAPEAAVDPLPESGGVPCSEVYRIGPVGVFDQPATVQIPLQDGVDPEAAAIYYFSESGAHPGWYPAENVVGWIAPGSRRTAVEDGQTYLEIQVNHSGVLQLGSPAQARAVSTVEGAEEGSRLAGTP